MYKHKFLDDVAKWCWSTHGEDITPGIAGSVIQTPYTKCLVGTWQFYDTGDSLKAQVWEVEADLVNL